MFFKPTTPILLLILLLTSCSGNQALEGLFSPDPQLQTPSPSPSASPSPIPSPVSTQLPPEFPQTIPIYPEAQIKAIAPDLTPTQGKISWESTDPSNLIGNYYQQQFESNNWSLSPETAENTLLARKDNLEVKISLNPLSSLTEIIVEYQPLTTSNQTEAITQPQTTVVIKDFDTIPEQYQQYVEELAKLGVFSSYDWGDNQTFEPNRVITRIEYARWLLEAHNLLYSDTPSQQIHLVSQATQPAFEDVPSSEADFPIIQGLAEAGVIPSRLTGDNIALKFRPDAPLTRADLIEWKVPLDLRKALPAASIENIKETWGFQDVTEIEPHVLQGLYVDYQNGEKANVRRAFGYTTLFQPNKSVTRAEAAAVLWYFGYQGQGISAQEVTSSSQS